MKPQFSMKIFQIKTIINVLTKQIISHVILPTFITKFKEYMILILCKLFYGIEIEVPLLISLA